MLIADMNDLRAQQEDASKNSMLETESVAGKKEDATFLRLALKYGNIVYHEIFHFYYCTLKLLTLLVPFVRQKSARGYRNKESKVGTNGSRLRRRGAETRSRATEGTLSLARKRFGKVEEGSRDANERTQVKRTLFIHFQFPKGVYGDNNYFSASS